MYRSPSTLSPIYSKKLRHSGETVTNASLDTKPGQIVHKVILSEAAETCPWSPKGKPYLGMTTPLTHTPDHPSALAGTHMHSQVERQDRGTRRTQPTVMLCQPCYQGPIS